MENVLVFTITMSLDILKQFVLRTDLLVMLVMIDHLAKVHGKTIKIDPAADRRPSEMESRQLQVLHFGPKVGPSLVHDAPHQTWVVSIQHLVFELPASLRLV